MQRVRLITRHDVERPALDVDGVDGEDQVHRRGQLQRSDVPVLEPHAGQPAVERAGASQRSGRRLGAERARVAVRKAVTGALDRLAEHDPSFAHLLRSTVRTGGVCVYDPDPNVPVRWLL